MEELFKIKVQFVNILFTIFLYNNNKESEVKTVTIKARLIEQLGNKVHFEINKPAEVQVDWRYVHGLTDLIIDLESTADSDSEIEQYFLVVKVLRDYYHAEKYEKPVQLAINCLPKIFQL